VRKIRPEVTRKNQKTDEPLIARMSRLGTTEKPENCNGLDLNGRRPPRRTSYNGTFVQRILVTAMQAMEGVPHRVCNFHSDTRNKVAPSAGSLWG